MDYLLEVNHLKTYFYGSEKQEIPAVDDVSFKVKQGRDPVYCRRERLRQECHHIIGDETCPDASRQIRLRGNSL